MITILRARLFPRCLALLLVAGAGLPPGRAAHPEPAPPAATTTAQADLAHARQLTLARKLAEAHPFYERSIAKDPANGEARYFYGISLLTEAAAGRDAAVIAALRTQARQQLLEAQRVGYEDPLLTQILAELQPGRPPAAPAPYSPNEDVASLMRAAEDAYAHGDFAKAARLHQQAFAIEPKNYIAALYCGDAYFAAKDYAAACEWFAKAVAIDPDRETAHRYWADALVHQSKIEEATAQFIDAVVAEPYNRMTRTRFHQYAQSVGLSARTESMKLPDAAVKITPGKTEIQVSSGQGGYAWALASAWAAACSKFRAEDFARQFPGEKEPRRSLPEEVTGLSTMLQVAREMAAAKEGRTTPDQIAQWQPALDLLAEIQKAGLLEAFVLLERADNNIARDYAAYRAAHRDELRRYIRVYWCGLE